MIESPLRIPQWGQIGRAYKDVVSDIETGIKEECKEKLGKEELCLKYRPEIDADSCFTKGESGDFGNRVVTDPPAGTPVPRDSVITIACKKGE
ncbi:MAG TPA: hypothetical protein VFO16_10450 [Pseudonocardiaceae bacterium]|nr:hypothetical protein [Pseudonocardiaceae bacterium]